MNLDRSDIKMSTIETKYFYNGDNVTCELFATLKTPDVFDALFGPIVKVVKATAKCHPDDGYNKKLGERIALARAESKAYRQLANEMNRRYEYVVEAIETLAPYRLAFNEKAEKCISHNAEYIKQIQSKY